MKKCPFCGREMTDDEFNAIIKAHAAAGGRAITDRKKAAITGNMVKARAAISPERRADILAKARAAKAAKKAKD